MTFSYTSARRAVFASRSRSKVEIAAEMSRRASLQHDESLRSRDELLGRQVLLLVSDRALEAAPHLLRIGRTRLREIHVLRPPEPRVLVEVIALAELELRDQRLRGREITLADERGDLPILARKGRGCAARFVLQLKLDSCLDHRLLDGLAILRRRRVFPALDGAERGTLERLDAARILDHRLGDVARRRDDEAHHHPAFLARAERARRVDRATPLQECGRSVLRRFELAGILASGRRANDARHEQRDQRWGRTHAECPRLMLLSFFNLPRCHGRQGTHLTPAPCASGRARLSPAALPRRFGRRRRRPRAPSRRSSRPRRERPSCAR